MAASYNVVSQSREVQVLGPTQVLDVERVGFVTSPTGIYVEFPVPLEAWVKQGAGPWMQPLADTIEGLIANTPAVGGDFVQDVDQAGLLIDYLDFIVEYKPPDTLGLGQTGTARIPLGALSAATDPFMGRIPPDASGNPQTPEGIIDQVYQALVATASL